MSEQECGIKKYEEGPRLKLAKQIATQVDTLITTGAKDLPIAKLYQVVKIGVTIANGLHNYKSEKLKKMMQVVIVRLLKIFNVYFFILKVKILAAKKQSQYNNDPKRKKHLQKIYKLDMKEIDNVLTEFNNLNNSNPPSSFFSKVNPDDISRKFSDITERLTRVVNDSLNHLTTLLGVTRYVSDLNYEDTVEFDAMNSPIISENCGEMDFAKIFEDLSSKIETLQQELSTNQTLAEEFLNEKKRDEHISKHMGCTSNEELVYVDTWGAPVPMCVKKKEQTIETPSITTPTTSQIQTTSPTTTTQTITQPITQPTTSPTTQTTTKPKRSFLSSIFGTSKSKSKYLKYKQKYLDIKNN